MKNMDITVKFVANKNQMNNSLAGGMLLISAKVVQSYRPQLKQKLRRLSV